VNKKARTCGHWHYYYTAIGDLLVIFNSSVNFVIYIVTSRNFRQGLMLMQTASATTGTRNAGLAVCHNRRRETTGSTPTSVRTEYIRLVRQNAGGTATPSTELAVAAEVVRRSVALTPIAEHPTPLSTAPSTRYFEPKILLQ